MTGCNLCAVPSHLQPSDNRQPEPEMSCRKRPRQISNDGEESKESKRTSSWTREQDQLLLRLVKEARESRSQETTEEDEDWDAMALEFPGKNAVQCYKRYTILKSRIKESVSASAAATTMFPGDHDDSVRF